MLKRGLVSILAVLIGTIFVTSLANSHSIDQKRRNRKLSNSLRRILLERHSHKSAFAKLANGKDLNQQAPGIVWSDPYEPNNSSETAYPIAYGDTLSKGVINPSGDKDWFKFNGSAGDTVTIDIDADVLGSLLDSYIYLYDSDGATQLTSNDDWGGLDSRISNYVLPSSGTFYVEIRDYSDHGGNDYFYHLRLTNTLALGAISGTVADTLGTPLEDIQIEVYDADRFYPVAWTSTDSLGHYITREGLETGTYKVKTVSYWADYASLYYNNKPDWSSADTVHITNSDTVQGVDFNLYIGGKIKGAVRQWDGIPTPGEVLVFNENSGEFLGFAEADSLGNYETCPLATGFYKLFVYPWYYATLSFEWYSDKATWSTADSIYVNAPMQVLDKNFQLERGGLITGRAYAMATGVPLEDCEIWGWLYLSPLYGWLPYWYESYTDSMGSYILPGFRTGFYKVTASMWGYGLQWYDDEASLGSADLVSVIMPDTTYDINFGLRTNAVKEKRNTPTFCSLTLRNYPNPCCGSSTFRYYIPARSDDTKPWNRVVSLRIYDATGRVVRTLINDRFNSNEMSMSGGVLWDTCDDRGKKIPSGVYFCRLTVDNADVMKKLIVFR